MAGEGEEMPIPAVVATGIAKTEIEPKWQSLAPILERPGPFARNAEGFYPSAQNLQAIKDARVLVVGAGGLGCEILKDLALSGFTEIHVIDLDTIDLSNLNRQFLFRLKDVGKAKAEVAADFVMKRVKGVNIKHYNRRIETFDKSWYAQFDYVIAGLDNVQARQWLNATLVDLVQFTPTGEVDWKTVVPLVDGGTEAFSGQARVFVPHFTSCFECSIDSMPPAKGYAVCTIKNIPRLPEHCVIYALQVLWPRLLEFTSATEYKLHEKKSEDEKDPEAVKLDNDDVQHINWLMLRATERGEQFGIKGVTYSLTQQVVKNIIPAIASTNALISAACVSEVVKLRTFCGDRLDNFYMFIGAGQTGINGSAHQYQRKARCTVCRPRLMHSLPPTTLLSDLLNKLKGEMTDAETGLAPSDIQLSVPNPKAEGGKEIIYGKLMSYTHENLAKPIFSLFKSKDIIWAEGDGLTQKVQITFA